MANRKDVAMTDLNLLLIGIPEDLAFDDSPVLPKD